MKITRTKKGLYTAVIGIGKDSAGRHHTKRFTAQTKQDLMLSIAEFRAEAYEAEAHRTFGDALTAYIAAREPHRSPVTLRGYHIIDRGLKTAHSAFYKRELGRITDADVQAVVDAMCRDGYSVKTIRNWIGLINSVLIAEKLPPAHTIMPQRKIIDHPIPSAGEVRMMLCLLHGTPLEVPFNLAIMSLRRSEICAVTAEDIDEDDILHISKALVSPDGGGKIVKQTTKTDASNRYVQLSPHIARLIRQQGRATDMNPNSITRAFSRFLDQYRFPHYRLHDCRHFFASYCHSLGIPEADILAGGGWKTANVMRTVYRHSMARNKAGAAIASLTAHE